MSKLRPPVGPEDHAQGSADAPVTLVEYGDYECPHCGHAHPIVKQVLKRLGKSVRFVFRNFPLGEMHPHAVRAAQAAEAAGLQNEFWPMHDRLFEHQRALETDDLKRYAKQVGLDTTRFARDLDADAIAERVRSDFASGVRSGVNGTPTFFIDGTRFDESWDEDSLYEALRRASEKR
ncbi:MAG TPA: thioredoxin domain-containing protein [Myxococcota bacterium]|nr:thioredoxin domain-containing protein [Myxococcota bacterium]